MKRIGDLAVLDEGEGQPVLLLHGFPDSSRLWRHQIPALLGAGFRVVAPDLRGFGESEKTQEVEAYALRNLLADVVAVLDELGIERTHVVGHDWGAGLAWVTAGLAPERVERLYLEDLSRPGALTAALNWYRANVHPRRELGERSPFPAIAAPTMGIWSSGDDYLLEEPMVRSGEHVTGGWRYERIEGASHWLQLDEPERVNALLLDFFGRTGVPFAGRVREERKPPRHESRKEALVSARYTLKQLTEVKDAAPSFGYNELQEARFATKDLDAEKTGVSHHVVKPGKRQGFAHKHDEAEEVYVVIAGSGRMKLDSEIIEIGRLDAIRVAPDVTRTFEAGPDGLELLAVGARHDGDGEIFPDWWKD